MMIVETTNNIFSVIEEHKPTALTISIKRRPIRVEELKIIARLLKHRSCPPTLCVHLELNGLQAYELIFANLAPPHYTQKLTLEFINNNIRDLSWLITALRKGFVPPNTTFNFHDNEISSYSLLELASVLQNSPCPANLTFKLSANRVTDEFLIALAQAVEHPKYVGNLHVDLTDNDQVRLNGRGASALAKALLANPHSTATIEFSKQSYEIRFYAFFNVLFLRQQLITVGTMNEKNFDNFYSKIYRIVEKYPESLEGLTSWIVDNADKINSMTSTNYYILINSLVNQVTLPQSTKTFIFALTKGTIYEDAVKSAADRAQEFNNFGQCYNLTDTDNLIECFAVSAMPEEDESNEMCRQFLFKYYQLLRLIRDNLIWLDNIEIRLFSQDIHTSRLITPDNFRLEVSGLLGTLITFSQTKVKPKYIRAFRVLHHAVVIPEENIKTIAIISEDIRNCFQDLQKLIVRFGEKTQQQLNLSNSFESSHAGSLFFSSKSQASKVRFINEPKPLEDEATGFFNLLPPQNTQELRHMLETYSDAFGFYSVHTEGFAVLERASQDGTTLLHCVYQAGEIDLMLALMEQYPQFNTISAPERSYPILEVRNEEGMPLLNQLFAQNKIYDAVRWLQHGIAIDPEFFQPCDYIFMDQPPSEADLQDIQLKHDESYFLDKSSMVLTYFNRLTGMKKSMQLTHNQYIFIAVTLRLGDYEEINSTHERFISQCVLDMNMIKQLYVGLKHVLFNSPANSIWAAILTESNTLNVTNQICAVLFLINTINKKRTENNQTTVAANSDKVLVPQIVIQQQLQEYHAQIKTIVDRCELDLNLLPHCQFIQNALIESVMSYRAQPQGFEFLPSFENALTKLTTFYNQHNLLHTRPRNMP